jgi:hypothetical protein
MVRKIKVPCNKEKWLTLASQNSVLKKIEKNKEIENFNHVVAASQAYTTVNWQSAVALLHMVYGWMPRMLKITPHTPAQQQAILSLLMRAKAGHLLGEKELSDLKKFTNRSMVGASKLLHVLNPQTYPIWDSRVARVFLWNNVSTSTFNKPAHYLNYQNSLICWSHCHSVRKTCRAIRKIQPALKGSSDVRIIELVLFSKAGKKKKSAVL